MHEMPAKSENQNGGVNTTLNLLKNYSNKKCRNRTKKFN
jgi:hypothetical protein